MSLPLYGQDQFYGESGKPNYDWPNPQRPLAWSRSVSTYAWTDSLKLELYGKDTFFASPGNGPDYDYPNPLGLDLRSRAQPSVALKTWTDPVKLNLLGKDVFFDGPGNAPDYDYPNPQIPRRAITQITWTNPVSLPLYGKDQMFGVAGQPLTPGDWPVVRPEYRAAAYSRITSYIQPEEVPELIQYRREPWYHGAWAMVRGWLGLSSVSP
jgi:hypothetical protein